MLVSKARKDSRCCYQKCPWDKVITRGEVYIGRYRKTRAIDKSPSSFLLRYHPECFVEKEVAYLISLAQEVSNKRWVIGEKQRVAKEKEQRRQEREEEKQRVREEKEWKKGLRERERKLQEPRRPVGRPRKEKPRGRPQTRPMGSKRPRGRPRIHPVEPKRPVGRPRLYSDPRQAQRLQALRNYHKAKGNRERVVELEARIAGLRKD
jgi:hypothetical protein